MKRWLNLIASLGILLLLFTGCEDIAPEDRQMVEDFFWLWLESHDMEVVTDDGQIDPQGAVKIGGRLVTGRSGDEESDAALEALQVVAKINEADKLMAAGRANGDAAAMDQAIALRPTDWTYRLSRSALALQSGDMKAYATQMNEADILFGESSTDKLWYTNSRIQEWSAVEKRSADKWQSAEQCRYTYEELTSAYHDRHSLTANPQDDLLADQYSQMARDCQP